MLILLFLCVSVCKFVLYIPLHIDVKKDLKSITLKVTFFRFFTELRGQGI